MEQNIQEILTRKGFEEKFPNANPLDFNRFYIEIYSLSKSSSQSKNELVEFINNLDFLSIEQIYIQTKQLKAKLVKEIKKNGTVTSDDVCEFSLFALCYSTETLFECTNKICKQTESHFIDVKVIDYNNSLYQAYSCGELESGMLKKVLDLESGNIDSSSHDGEPMHGNKLVDDYNRNLVEEAIKEDKAIRLL